jgi:uncharacterized OB-fold protein
VTAPPVREGLFREDERGDPFLVGGRCAGCERLQFPRASTCPACGRGDVEDVRLADHGTLWGWTAVTAPPPGYLGDVPFGFGVVELADGLRVITRVEEADPSRLEFGMPMRLGLVELHGGDAGAVTTYTFFPDPPDGLAPFAGDRPTNGANQGEVDGA